MADDANTRHQDYDLAPLPPPHIHIWARQVKLYGANLRQIVIHTPKVRDRLILQKWFDYTPSRLNKTEQAARHRKAQAAYYARNAPVLRERSRIAMGEKKYGNSLGMPTVDSAMLQGCHQGRQTSLGPPRPPKSIAKSIVDDPGELSDDHLDAETPGLPDGELWMVPSSSSSPLPDPRGTMSWEEQDPAQEARLEYRHAAAANSTHFADRDSAGSPTSQERIAIEALASLAGPTAAQGTRGPVSVDSILEKAMQLSSLRSSDAAVQRGETSAQIIAAPALLAAAAEITVGEGSALGDLTRENARPSRTISSRHSAAGAPLSRAGEYVQQALREVATLNAATLTPLLTPPSLFDRSFWVRSDHHLFRGEYLQRHTYAAIRIWAGRVDQSTYFII
ncbi:hypothetical protein B0H12DRAFT_1241052 [Mycena haematopus]|nr:hypothetical protein B0H12DRAFT_1241052 [Mycena haematopus]